MSDEKPVPLCSVCGREITFQIRHCDTCNKGLCGRGICHDVRDLLCKGEHVHDDDACLVCGCLYENDCPSTDPYVINWSPTVRRRSESVT